MPLLMRNRYCVLPVSVMTRFGIGDVVGLEPVFRSEYVVEVREYSRAFDDFDEAGRDQVVAQRHALAFGANGDVVRNLAEPLVNAGKQLDRAPEFHQVLAVDADAARLGLLVHQVHVGDERIGAMRACRRVRLDPERLGILADLGQERVLLHRTRRQRAIEIVNECDGFLTERRLGTRRGNACPGGGRRRARGLGAGTASAGGARAGLLRHGTLSFVRYNNRGLR